MTNKNYVRKYINWLTLITDWMLFERTSEDNAIHFTDIVQEVKWYTNFAMFTFTFKFSIKN